MHLGRRLRRGSSLAVLVVLLLGAGPRAAAAEGSASVSVNGDARFQTISGFGVSEAFLQARLLMDDPVSVRRRVLDLLFGLEQGAGLSVLRNQVGSVPSYGTIEPVAPPTSTSPPTYAPIGDDDGQLWLASTLRRQYGLTQIVADAWGPPPFMKTNSSDSGGGVLCGVPGTRCASGSWTRAYADYLVQYLLDYRAHGISVEYLGFENEPTLATAYTSMVMSPRQTVEFIGVLGSALAGSGLHTQVECCDTEGWGSAVHYVRAIEADRLASDEVGVFTSHGYTRPPTRRLPGWAKPTWETEWSTFDTWDPAWDDGTDASGLTWAQHIMDALTRADVSAFFYWWGSNQLSNDNEGLVRVSGSTVTPSGRLWAFAAFSRYVRPGAVRIGADAHGQDLEAAAFRNADGTSAIPIINRATSSSTVRVSVSGAGLPTTGSVDTYTTRGSEVAAHAAIRLSHGAFDVVVPARSIVTCVVRG